jgi:site-specific recombinase XerD
MCNTDYNNIPEIKEYFDTISIDKSPKTIRTYGDAVNKMISYLHIENFQDIRKITAKDLRDHQNNMKRLGLSSSSINTNMRPIRAMFNWLVENEYLNKSPMDAVHDVKCEKKVVTFLSEDEESLMINACKNELDRLLLYVLLQTGIRRAELCGLKLNDFDGSHILVHGKGDKQRRLILTPYVNELLNKYLEHRNKKYGNSTDALFVSKMGKPFTGTAIYLKIKSIAKLANLPEDRIEKIHVHITRHTFCTNMLEICSLPQVQAMMGHSDAETTMKYAHVRNSSMDAAMLNQKEIG